MRAKIIANGLASEAIEFEFVDPTRALRNALDRQTFHRRGERDSVHRVSGSRGVLSSGATGSTRVGSLFCTLPTLELTLQAFISSAGNGRSKSIGKCEGSPGSSHRS